MKGSPHRALHRSRPSPLSSRPTERARLLDLLEQLHEEDWQRPTPCPGWTVLGLACHQLGGDFGLLSRRRDSYMGTPSPEGLSEDEFID
jgi:uncharacterized protein (TIGR03083 family)